MIINTNKQMNIPFHYEKRGLRLNTLNPSFLDIKYTYNTISCRKERDQIVPIIKHKFAYSSYIIISVIIGLFLKFNQIEPIDLIKILEYIVVVATFAFAMALLLYVTKTSAKKISNVLEAIVTIIMSFIFIAVVNSISLENSIIDIILIYVYVAICHIIGIRLANALIE